MWAAEPRVVGMVLDLGFGVFFWLHQALVVAHKIFGLPCGMQDLVFSTRDENRAPCIRSLEF